MVRIRSRDVDGLDPQGEVRGRFADRAGCPSDRRRRTRVATHAKPLRSPACLSRAHARVRSRPACASVGCSRGERRRRVPRAASTASGASWRPGRPERPILYVLARVRACARGSCGRASSRFRTQRQRRLGSGGSGGYVLTRRSAEAAAHEGVMPRALSLCGLGDRGQVADRVRYRSHADHAPFDPHR
jgi:hypothetical protein